MSVDFLVESRVKGFLKKVKHVKCVSHTYLVHVGRMSM